MRRITKIITALTLAAGVFGSGTAMAMGDGYDSDSTTYYYYHSSPGTYSYSSPNATTYYYYSSPGTSYYYNDTYGYAPYGSYGGYYDNPYRPYWSYNGPLGQGSGHDVRIGR